MIEKKESTAPYEKLAQTLIQALREKYQENKREEMLNLAVY